MTAIARTVSDYVKENRSAATVATDLAAAIEAARRDGGRVATLIVPHDSQTGAADGTIQSPRAQPQKTYSLDQVTRCAAALTTGNSALLLGGEALAEAGLMLAGRIAASTGAGLLCDTFFARMERGVGTPRSNAAALFCR